MINGFLVWESLCWNKNQWGKGKLTKGILMKKWPTIKTEKILDAKVFSYFKTERESPLSKKKGLFDVLHCPDWVNVMALTANNECLLVKQYRHGQDDITTEIPGGVIDSHESDPLEAAKRELLEETGYASDSWERLGSVSPNPAFINNYCHIYLALNAQKTSEQNLDPFEEIEIFTRPLDDIPELIRNGTIQHSLVVSAFNLYFLKYKL